MLRTHATGRWRRTTACRAATCRSAATWRCRSSPRSGEVIGGLFFGHREAGVFTERTERIVGGVAAQAAIAIDNARLYEAAQRAADERRACSTASARRAREAERISAMKDEFLATLSHELRTPLNAILGWSQVLRSRRGRGGAAAQGLETIERNARIQAQLIEDLLDMSRIMSGKMRLDVQPVNPVTFVEAAMETVRPAADAKGIRLEKLLDPQAGLPATRAVCSRWCGTCSPTPSSSPPERHGRGRCSGATELAHRDHRGRHGHGIKPEFLPHVFERFRQADASRRAATAGSGSGLSIVKHLVELHGGTVQAASAGEGRGATFTVRLPLAWSCGAGAATGRAPSWARPKRSGGRQTRRPLGPDACSWWTIRRTRAS